MRILAHLSDLHFGRTDARVVEALLDDLHRHRPDLVVISGDLTQRARSHQFAEARAFLERLPAPAVVVPGNHDLYPLYRPLSRIFRPRSKFHRHLPEHGPLPVWSDGEVVVMGLDSTRSLRWKEGRLKDRHLEHVAETVAAFPAQACRVAFLHHPLSASLHGHPFEALAERGVDLVLAGHVHKVHVEVIQADTASCILVQASTACSTRLREDANGYGLIRVDMPDIEVAVQGWSGEAFHPVHHHRFRKSGGHWQPVKP
ncbi:MAG: metallophosphoesterase family protein [Solirubrobacterales bacterium]